MVRFQLTCSPLTFHSSQRTSVSPGQLEAGTGDGLQVSAVVDDPERLRDLSAFLVKNKPAVFHTVRERTVRRTSQDTPASLYKLDSKVKDMYRQSPAKRRPFRAERCYWLEQTVR